MYSVILCTSSSEESEEIARRLVEEKLSACVSIMPVTSFYRWRGRVEKENENLLIIKTRSTRVNEVISRIKELHSYELPEIIVLPIVGGHEDYLDWLREETE